MTRRFILPGVSVLVSVAALMWAGMQDPPAGAPANKDSKEAKEKDGRKESEDKAKRLASAAIHVKVVGAGSAITNEKVTVTVAGREWNERTNREGIALFTLTDVSPGPLHVLLTTSGFETFQQDYPLRASDTHIEVELKRRGANADAEKNSASSNSK